MSDRSGSERTFDRRTLLRSGAAAATVGLAGCPSLSGSGGSGPPLQSAFFKVLSPAASESGTEAQQGDVAFALRFDRDISYDDYEASDLLSVPGAASVRLDSSLSFDWTERFRGAEIDPDRAASLVEESDAAAVDDVSSSDARDAAAAMSEGPDRLNWDDGRTLQGVAEEAIEYGPAGTDRFAGARASFPSVGDEGGIVTDSTTVLVQFTDGFVYRFPRDSSAGGYGNDGRYDIDVDEGVVNAVNAEHIRDQMRHSTARELGETTITDDLWRLANPAGYSDPLESDDLETVTFGDSFTDADGGGLTPSFSHRPSPLLTMLRVLAQFRGQLLRNIGGELESLASSAAERSERAWDLATGAAAAGVSAPVLGPPPSSPDNLASSTSTQLLPAAMVVSGEGLESVVSGARTAGRIGSSTVGPTLSLISTYQGAQTVRERGVEFGRFVQDAPGANAASVAARPFNRELCVGGEPVEADCYGDRDAETMTTVGALANLSEFQHRLGCVAVATADRPLAADGPLNAYWKTLLESFLQCRALESELREAPDMPTISPTLRSTLVSAADLCEAFADQIHLELDLLASVAASYTQAGTRRATVRETANVMEDRDPGVEYTLTVTDSTGGVVGSTTVTDTFPVDEYGDRVQFATIGDFASDDDHAVVDYLRVAGGETVENWSERNLAAYRRTQDGGGTFALVSEPTADGPAALEMRTGSNWTRYTSKVSLLPIDRGTTIRGDISHETDVSATYAMQSAFGVGVNSDGSDGVYATLVNPGSERTAGARLGTPNGRERIEFTPETGEFYTLEIAISDA